ncbi:nucleolin 2-like [Cryptomeria japonica]|uniref:nucleolin 2-like n=1 Tax=Cryptomeria japonica TaxID=3369 RepID=UPI0027DA545E|nr:nucleolin 2-like [Cryptomeria japonica]
MEPENEVKKGENSNNENQDCVCSNNQIESTKEGEKGRELNNKNDLEDQEVGSISQEKEEVSPKEVVHVSSISKSIEENFNEAQEFNPSDIEPLLLLTNGSPNPLQYKTPSHSVVMDILEENLRILGTQEGKSNKEEPNGGKAKRKLEGGDSSMEKATSSKKSKSASRMETHEEKNDIEEIGKDGSEMDTDDSDGEDSWKDEEVGVEDEGGENESDNDSPIHNANTSNYNSKPMVDMEDKDNEDKDVNYEREESKEPEQDITKDRLSEDKEIQGKAMDDGDGRPDGDPQQWDPPPDRKKDSPKSGPEAVKVDTEKIKEVKALKP